MKQFLAKNNSFAALSLFLFIALEPFVAHVLAGPPTKGHNDTLRVGVVGDTGIGERAYRPGFIAVIKALQKHQPDVLLHLGDFLYQPKILPKNCPERYVHDVRKTLADPFQFKLFVPGDNDLPPNRKKPKASGCWGKIDPMDNSFDSYPTSKHEPRLYEGTAIVGNSFFAVLNTFPWKDPEPWLGPRIKKAKNQGLWTIITLHEPAITTAWYLEKRDTVLKQLIALEPDLVFAGHQHSYERFHQIKMPKHNGSIPFVVPESGSYLKGDGTIFVVSGGGGAYLKPFADMQKFKKRTAPKAVFDMLAKRALMNHYLILEIQKEKLEATTYRVCTQENINDNPKWKADKPMWNSIKLDCEGQAAGVTTFERFQIKLKKRDGPTKTKLTK